MIERMALEQEPYKLPEQWKWARLGEVCKINPSKSEIKNIPDSAQVTFIPMVAVSEVTGKIENPQVRRLGEVKKGYTYFKEGDVLFAKITPCMENGKCAVAINLANGLGFGTTEFHVIRPSKSVLSEWVHLYLRQPSTREEAKRSFTGSVGQQRVPKEFLENLQIPVPPLEEQRCIVKRIEQLLSKVEEARRLRKRAKEEAEQIMQAALHNVFSMAEEWGWEPVKLGETTEIVMGQSPPSTTYNENRVGLPFYQGKVDFGELYPAPRVWCSKPNKIAYPRDILISVRAPVGPVNLCKEKSCIGRGLGAIRSKSSAFDNLFLFYYLKSVEKIWVGKGSTFKAIRKRDLESFYVPHPPLKEQKKIVAHLNKIRETVESLKKLQQKTEEELEKLPSAVLNKAFQGKLS